MDNFRPFLERAEIKNSDGITKYLHTWNLNGTTLEKSVPSPNEALSDGTYTINLRFSEPVMTPTVAINTYEGTLTLASSDPAGNQKNFSANFTVGNNSPQEGLRTMTVNAADLAGNALLLLPVTKTTINPVSEITRNSEGTMQGTPGSASVDFTIDRRPYAQAVQVKDGEGEVFYSAQWTPLGDPVTGYKLLKGTDKALSPGGMYTLTLTFGEPLDSVIVNASGIEGGIPVAAVAGGEGRVFDGSFTVPDGGDLPADLNLWIASRDLTENEGVSLARGLEVFEPARLSIEEAYAGPDMVHVLRLSDDTEPPTVYMPLLPGGMSLAVTGSNTREGTPWFRHASTPTFRVEEWGSGIKDFSLFRESAPEALIAVEFPPDVPIATLSPYFEHDGADYYLTAGDRLSNITTAYFHIDRHPPQVYLERMKVWPAAGGFSLDAYAVMVDTVAGIGAGPEILLNPGAAAFPQAEDYAGPSWPPGDERREQVFPGLAGPATTGEWLEYAFIGHDRASNPQSYFTVLLKNDHVFELPLSSRHNGLPASPTGIYVAENHGISFALPGCATITPPQYSEVLVQATARAREYLDGVPVEGPGTAGWTGEYPVELGYTPETGVTLYHLKDGVELARASGIYLPRYSTVTISAVGTPGEYLCGEEAVQHNGVFSARLAWTNVGIGGQIETQWIDAGFDMAAEIGVARVEVAQITAPGSITLSRVGYDPRIPGYRLADSNEVYDIKVTAQYAGELRISFRLPEGLSAEQTANADIYHYDAGQWVKVTSGRADGWVSCSVAHASPFALVVPYADTEPPSTALASAGDWYEEDGVVYLSSGSAAELRAVDFPLNEERSGVATTYYLVDVEPTPACLSAAKDPLAAPGTCANPYYRAPFFLAEGERSVHYFSVDRLGNEEALKSRTVRSDGTAPVAALLAAGAAVPDGGASFLVEGSSITLEAFDPVSGGVTSGLDEAEYLIDVTFESCPPEEEGDGEEGEDDDEEGGPRGICGNSGYEGPFTLTPGTHTVYYLAHDRVGNASAVRTAHFTVVPSSGAAAEAAISISSGPIGMPFTITGEGFGTYSAGITVVLIGESAAPLTLWTDTQIKGTVPGTLAAGEHPVVVMRGAEVLAETSSFTVVVPALADIAPSSGPIGLPFTLAGAGFGNYVANYTRVLIGGATCPLTLWTDTQIKGAIPGTIAPGAHEVVVERALNGGLVQSAPVSFDLRDMEADWIAPSSGPIGMPFTIGGSGFGNYVANFTTVLIGGATCPLTLWTDTQIKGTVPGGLSTGQYPVLVERKTADGGVMHSPAMSFTVLAVDAASMTPVAGPIGMPFTIYGTGFGNYSAGWTRVLIGGTTAPLTLWTDSQIKGAVPGTIEPGAHEVVVERQLNGGLVSSQPLPFTLTVPELAAVAPSSGPIGLPFTLTGSGFGNYVANRAKVLIGGTTCPLTLWTDGQIKGTVPGTIDPGTHEVLVERAFNGGVSRSQALSFELADPILTAVSPSPAAVLAPFTLTGYNFGNYVAGRSEALIGGATAQLTLWTDTQIKGKLPALGEGEYPVLVRRSFNGGVAQSQASSMTIVEPSVSSMTPVSGQPGTTFSVFGTGFGPYDAVIARVLVGGLPGSLSLWTDGRINGTIPAELGVGTHTVIVSRGQYQADPLEFYVPGGGYNPAFMAPLSPSTAFRLGEVYVYPNPAKGGAAPIFHLEFGLADKVELKVYSVAGSLVHERTLTGPPQVTSPIYAYEYAWDGHIASGVYYFTVEAERAGAKLKARGKFAVVR
ncbi:MAG: IPT/TIG domain-containing protein [Elusimicrobiales bacterium]|nr:IPT/TIG domain-containing protein [Elusimicrobiales bacterium]